MGSFRQQKRTSHKDNDKGFILIEVLMAVVILSVALVAAIQSSTQAAHTVGNRKVKALAHIVASNKLTELQLQRTWPTKSKSSEKVDMAGQRWVVTTLTQPTVNELFKDRIKMVEVTAALDNKPKDSLYSVQGFVVRSGGNAAERAAIANELGL